jgi:hypothetical protein
MSQRVAVVSPPVARGLWLPLAFPLLLLLLLRPGAAFAAPPSVWIADDGTKVLETAAPRAQSAVWRASDGVVRLRGARNETLAFQSIVRGGATGLTGVDATISAFRQAGSSALVALSPSASLYRAWFLNVTEPSTSMYGPLSSTGPGSYPDPLVPFDAPNGGAPFNVAAARNGIVWADVAIPDGAGPGDWEATLTVSTAGPSAESTSVPIRLRVDPFSLSHEQHLPTYFYYGPEYIAQAHGVDKYTGPFFPIDRAYRRMAHDHRFCMSTSVYPDFSGEGSATVVDFTSWHDDFASPYLDGTAYPDGVGDKTYCLPIGPGYPYPGDYAAGINGPLFGATFRTILQQFADHFRARGWYDRSFVYIIDEPNDAAAYATARTYGTLVHQSRSGFPFLVTEQPTPQDPTWGSLVGSVDIWDACNPQYDPTSMAARQAAGERAWTYNGGEPYAGSQLIDSGGIGMRTWPWIAWRYHVDGWDYWSCCYFYDRQNLDTATNDVWTDPLTFDQRRSGGDPGWADWGNGDGTLFYPGTPRGIAGPVSSMRMKELRRGMQDYEYLWLARANGRADLADAQARTMIPVALGAAEGRPATAWSEDPSVWEQARATLADALVGARSAPALGVKVKAGLPAGSGGVAAGWGSGPLKVSYGARVSFLGRAVPAVTTMTLERLDAPGNPGSPGAVWPAQAVGAAAPGGATAVFSLKPARSAWWRVSHAADSLTLFATSTPVRVGVASVVRALVGRNGARPGASARVPLGTTVRVSASVSPLHAGRAISFELQRYAKWRSHGRAVTGWRRVTRRSVRLSRRSAAAWAFRPRARGRYRLRGTFGDPDHAWAASPWRSLTVR